MSKSSTVTVRAQPATGKTSVSGPCIVHAETFTITTDTRVQLVDLTDHLMALVRATGVGEGTVNLFSTHTTCTVFINEFQDALLADIRTFLEDIVRQDAAWLHNDPRHSDCDRTNADAHLRALLLGHSLTLQVSGGEPVLGRWQRVLMAELDGPRDRTLRASVMGVA